MHLAFNSGIFQKISEYLVWNSFQSINVWPNNTGINMDKTGKEEENIVGQTLKAVVVLLIFLLMNNQLQMKEIILN